MTRSRSFGLSSACFRGMTQAQISDHQALAMQGLRCTHQGAEHNNSQQDRAPPVPKAPEQSSSGMAARFNQKPRSSEKLVVVKPVQHQTRKSVRRSESRSADGNHGQTASSDHLAAEEDQGQVIRSRRQAMGHNPTAIGTVTRHSKPETNTSTP